MSNHLDRVREIFAKAIALDPAARLDFVTTQCEGAPALLPEIHALIDSYNQAGDFLNRSLPEMLGASVYPQPELSPGLLLAGRYRVLERIANGGFATVYKGSDELLGGKAIVIKVLDRIRNSEIVKETIKAEIGSLGTISHPGIVGISDLGSLEDGTPFLVLNFIPGSTLRSIIDRNSLSQSQTGKIVRGIGQALSAAHREGISHLDLKPENIIVSDFKGPGQRATIIDFGISRFKATAEAGIAASSCNYCSPEQAEHPSPRSDIYSLGLISSELLVGHLPNPSTQGKLSWRSLTSPRTMKAITRALHPDPERRFQNVEDFTHAAFPKPLLASPLIAGLALAFLLAAVLTFLLWRPARPAYYVARPEPFVSTPAFESRPAFSYDDKWIYYVSGQTDAGDIYRKLVAGGQPELVVASKWPEDTPQPSPSGKYLAFIRRYSGYSTLIVKSLDSTSAEREIGRSTDYEGLSWGPSDASLIVAEVSSLAGGTTLRVVDVASSRWRNLLPPQDNIFGDDFPAISPDGKSLAFARRWTQQSADLMLLDLDSNLNPQNLLRRLTSTMDRVDSIQWTPDGKELFYALGPLSDKSLMRLSVSGGDPVRIPLEDHELERIALAKHTNAFVYSGQRTDENIWQLDLKSTGVPVAKSLIASTYGDDEARISPDGKLVAFESNRSGSVQVWLSSADGSSPKQLTSFSNIDTISVVWPKDPSRLVVSIRSKDLGERVFVVNVQGEPNFIPIFSEALACDISGDGRFLYVSKKQPAHREIWRVDFPSGLNPRRMIDTPAYFARESDDGNSLIFTHRLPAEGVWMQPLPSGTPTRLIPSLYRRNLLVPARGGFYYVAHPPDSNEQWRLYFRNNKSAASKEIFKFPSDVFWGLDLSPDQSKLIFSQFDLSGADLMLVANYR